MRKICITEDQKKSIFSLINDNKDKNHMLLNEENRTQKKKCVENIYNNMPNTLRKYANVELTKLPYNLQMMLNPDGALFKSVSTNQTGSNKFIDFLRINLYQQFGIGRNSNLTQFIPGISRMACVDCHFYAFDLSIDGGKILELGRVLRLIDKKPEYMLSDISLDSDLNGLSCDNFLTIFKPKVNHYKENMFIALSNDNEHKTVKTKEYTIIPIDDKIVDNYGSKVLLPTSEGRAILSKFGNYTDWCVCNNQYANEEYSQYLSNGGKMYICAKEGFEEIKRPTTTNTPLDEYGLSLLCVIIGQDGLPTNVTTRYNHDFGGENHSEMWEAIHLQKLLKVNFTKVFKPRSKNELKKLHLAENKIPAAQDQVKNRVNSGILDTMCTMEEDIMKTEEWLVANEGAEPESNTYKIGSEGGNNDYFHVMNESKNDDSEVSPYLKEIAKFMKEDGLNIYPYPEVELDWSEQNGLFITTGYYLPSDKKIVLFCKDRHPKDILRSYAHEMIHHMQNLDGKNLNFSNKDGVKDNKELENLESEAYLKGNIYFRKWTEYEKSKNGVLNESIISVSLLRELTRDLDESLEPNEVDLSSFNIKKNLNPKFWKNDLLDSRIRMKLLDIADDFIEYLGVDWVKPEDITITGSLSNYNWNQKYSDIDLHILMDFSKVDERTDFVEEYFKSKKELWNEEHKDLKIFGFPIEVYVQDIKQEHISSGVYSLEKNKWLEKPERTKLSNVKVNKLKIKKIVSKYTEIIDNLDKEYKTQNNDKYKIERICFKADKLFDKIKELRISNLSDKKSEMSEGNIIFKCLRRLGYIEKLDNIIIDGYNKLNSLP